MMRVMASELAPLIAAGHLSVAQADRMLGGDSEHLRRFLELVAKHTIEQD